PGAAGKHASRLPPGPARSNLAPSASPARGRRMPLSRSLRWLALLALPGLTPGARLSPGAHAAAPPAPWKVGVARVDITPSYPVPLRGLGVRGAESEGVPQRIWAKALAVGDPEPAVLLTIDNLGVPANLVAELAGRLGKHGVRPERLA